MTAAIRAVLVDRHQNRKFLFLALVGCEHANSSALASGFCVLFFFFQQGSAAGQTRPHLTFSTRPDEKAWEQQLRVLGETRSRLLNHDAQYICTNAITRSLTTSTPRNAAHRSLAERAASTVSTTD